MAKELRVYVLNIDIVENYNEYVTDEIFIELAEKEGTIYSLKGFQNAFNDELVNSSTDLIRFIEVEV